MKNTNKKGFTIVELVIVIAVIAILAAVLIPTFSNVVENANRTADMEECKSAMVQITSATNGNLADEYYVFDAGHGYMFHYTKEAGLETDSAVKISKVDSKFTLAGTGAFDKSPLKETDATKIEIKKVYTAAADYASAIKLGGTNEVVITTFTQAEKTDVDKDAAAQNYFQVKDLAKNVFVFEVQKTAKTPVTPETPENP